MALTSGARAVVTGAGSGLGRAVCVELARRGARILASDVDLDQARATVALLGAADAHAVRCDVTRVEEVTALADEAEARFGGVDLVVNNAGVAVGGRVGDVPLEDWRWVVDVNLWGVIYGCHVFAPRFKRQGRGAILNVASAAGLLSAPNMGPYNVTKAGVVALSETLFGELRGDGVTVTVLCPTFFKTNIARASRGGEDLRHVVEDLMERSKTTAEDVARAALDGVDAGELYVVPMADGRWFWRLKRAAPHGFHTLVPRILAMRAARVKKEPATR